MGMCSNVLSWKIFFGLPCWAAASTQWKDVKINYAYHGDWYKWDFSSKAFSGFKIRFGAFCVAELAMYLVCALQTSYTNTTPLVAGGGILSIIAQIFQWIGLIQLCLCRLKVKERDCREIYTKLHGSCMACAILLGISAVGALLVKDLPLFAGYAIDGLIALYLYAQTKSLTFTILPGDDSDFSEGWHFS